MFAPIRKCRLHTDHSIHNDAGQVVASNSLNAITSSTTLVANVVVLPMIVGRNGTGLLAKYNTSTPINDSGYLATNSHSSEPVNAAAPLPILIERSAPQRSRGRSMCCWFSVTS